MTSAFARLLTALVGLMPRAFRDQFEDDMREQILRDLERARDRGAWSMIAFTLLTGVDLARAGLAERWNPTWVETRAASTTEGEGMMRQWMRDLYYAYRSLRRAPGFTLMTAGTLGLAIGVNTGIFAVVDTVLLDPLPIEHSDRIVFIGASAPGTDFPDEFGVSNEFYLEYRKATDVLEDVSTYNDFTSTLRVGDRVERVRMSQPTRSFFSVLGAEPALGRLPMEEDEDRVALISHRAWVDWFGADPEVLGRSYSISTEMRTVIGVMGPEFRLPHEETLVWIPDPIRAEGVRPGRFFANLVARVAPDTELDVVGARLDAIALTLPELYGGSADYTRLMEQHRAVVRPFRDQLLGDVSGPLWILLGAVTIVLLIACANVGNLFLVRAERRQRDLAVRRAIGAGRGQIIRSMFAEALLIAAAAGGVAVFIAWLGLPAFLRAAPDGAPRLADVGLTPTTLAYTGLACLLAAVACGLLPAVRSGGPALDGLREGSRGSTRRRHWGRDGLVVAQTALALVLLIGSALLLRSFQELRQVDPGYETADIFTFQLGLEAEEGLDDGPAFARFHIDFANQVRALPGVESVGIIENLPLNEGYGSIRVVTEEIASDPEGGPLVGRNFVGGDYFETMGIEVLRGRAFRETDHTSEPGNVVISQAAADRLWPDRDPIGQRLQWPALETWETVVGVVENVMHNSLRDEAQPVVYFPLVAQNPVSWALSSPAYVVRTARAAEIAPEIRSLARTAAPSAPMYRMYTMDGLAADSMVQLSFTMLTLGIASVLALLLGTVGLYGVLSYVVAERTREIGVRMALGAQAERVRRMVVVQGTRVVVIGVVIGVAVAAGATRALAGLLYGVEAVDPLTFASVSATMLLVGMLASYVPARRASSVDPIESLREG